jgi:hypothetical protein
MKRLFRAATLVAFFGLVFNFQPAQAANGPCEYEYGPCEYGQGYEWIVGIDINTYTCFALDTEKQQPVLQFLIGNKWVTKVKAQVNAGNSNCQDPEFPYFTLFKFKMDTRGNIAFGNEFKKRIKSRIYIPKVGNFKPYYGTIFTNNVYPSIKSFENQIRSNVIAQMNQDLAEALADAQSESSGSLGSNANAKLNGCTYKNKQLFGKVQIVEYGADFKVQKVDYGSDLKVRAVDYGASSCGKWQFVEYGANFKVQFVDYGSDFKVQFVNYGEGLR